MKRAHKFIKDVVVLVGQNPRGELVYSDSLTWHEYYDNDHIWDNPETIAKNGMTRLRGMLFDNRGNLSQEFDNKYSKNGKLIGGWVRHKDGVITKQIKRVANE
jgi:hypothetical protein